MLRIASTYLERMDSEYYHLGRLYDGLVYESLEGMTLEVFRCVDGKVLDSNEVIPEYKDTVIVNVSSRALHDFEDLEEGDLFLMSGVKYTGIACRFSHGYCEIEAFFKDGYLVFEREWAQDGTLRHQEGRDANLVQQSSWYASSELCDSRLTLNDRSLLLEVAEGSFLNRLCIDDGFFDEMAISSARFSPINCIDDLLSFKIDRELFLHGSGIDDNLLKSMVNMEGFAHIRKLVISETSLDLKFVLSVLNHRKIKELRVCSTDDVNDHQIIKALQTFKSQCIYCKIFLNDFGLD